MQQMAPRPSKVSAQKKADLVARIEDEVLSADLAELSISSFIFKVPIEFVAAAPENTRSLEHAKARNNLSHLCALQAGIKSLTTRFANPFIVPVSHDSDEDSRLPDVAADALKAEEGKPLFTPAVHPIEGYFTFEEGVSSGGLEERLAALKAWLAVHAAGKAPGAILEIDRDALVNFSVCLAARVDDSDDDDDEEEEEAAVAGGEEGVGDGPAKRKDLPKEKRKNLDPQFLFARILAGQGRLEVTRRFWKKAGRPESKLPYAYVKLFDPAILKNVHALHHIVQDSNGEKLGRTMTAIEFFETIFAYDHLPDAKKPAMLEHARALAADSAAALRRAHPSDGRIQFLTKLTPLPEVRELMRRLFTSSPIATSMFIHTVHLVGRILGGGGALKVAASYMEACEFYARQFEGSFKRGSLLVQPEPNTRSGFVASSVLQKVQRLLLSRITVHVDRNAHSVTRQTDDWVRVVATSAFNDAANTKVKGKTTAAAAKGLVIPACPILEQLNVYGAITGLNPDTKGFDLTVLAGFQKLCSLTLSFGNLTLSNPFVLPRLVDLTLFNTYMTRETLTAMLNPSTLPSLCALAFRTTRDDEGTFSQPIETLCPQLHMLSRDAIHSDGLADGTFAGSRPWTLVNCSLSLVRVRWYDLERAHHLHRQHDPTTPTTGQSTPWSE
ncbi:hypothetical protein JCM5296_007460 [Sporobolomyces johnsonii]